MKDNQLCFYLDEDNVIKLKPNYTDYKNNQNELQNELGWVYDALQKQEVDVNLLSSKLDSIHAYIVNELFNTQIHTQINYVCGFSLRDIELIGYINKLNQQPLDNNQEYIIKQLNQGKFDRPNTTNIFGYNPSAICLMLLSEYNAKQIINYCQDGSDYNGKTLQHILAFRQFNIEISNNKDKGQQERFAYGFGTPQMAQIASLDIQNSQYTCINPQLQQNQQFKSDIIINLQLESNKTKSLQGLPDFHFKDENNEQQHNFHVQTENVAYQQLQPVTLRRNFNYTYQLNLDLIPTSQVKSFLSDVESVRQLKLGLERSRVFYMYLKAIYTQAEVELIQKYVETSVMFFNLFLGRTVVDERQFIIIYTKFLTLRLALNVVLQAHGAVQSKARPGVYNHVYFDRLEPLCTVFTGTAERYGIQYTAQIIVDDQILSHISRLAALLQQQKKNKKIQDAMIKIVKPIIHKAALAAANGRYPVCTKFYEFFIKIGSDASQKSPMALAAARLNMSAARSLAAIGTQAFDFCYLPSFLAQKIDQNDNQSVYVQKCRVYPSMLMAVALGLYGEMISQNQLEEALNMLTESTGITDEQGRPLSCYCIVADNYLGYEVLSESERDIKDVYGLSNEDHLKIWKNIAMKYGNVESLQKILVRNIQVEQLKQ